MGLFQRLRRAAPPPSPRPGPSAPAGAVVTPAQLHRLIPCNRLSEAELASWSGQCQRLTLPAATEVFRQGEGDGSGFYLLKGEVTLDYGDKSRVLGSTATPGYPLACGRRYAATAITRTAAEIVRVPAELMTLGLQRQRPVAIEAACVSDDFSHLPPPLRQSEVFYTFWRHYRGNHLDFPPLPQVAIRLRRAIRQEIGVREAARIVQSDPVVSARLIEIANSPLYRGASPITSCQQAINRIGLNATRNLVTSLTLGRLFKAANPRVERWLTRIWQENVRVSSFSYVLARHLRDIDAEQALLAGLLSHVGALPFLYFAADFPADRLSDEVVAAAIAAVRGPLGQALLRAWDFPPAFCEVPRHCEDWYYDDSGPLTLSDVVTLATWHVQLGRRQPLPPIETLPSFQKLDLREISPAFSLGLLHNAREHLAQIRTLLQL